MAVMNKVGERANVIQDISVYIMAKDCASHSPTQCIYWTRRLVHLYKLQGDPYTATNQIICVKTLLYPLLV